MHRMKLRQQAEARAAKATQQPAQPKEQ
jgi:hypothetical protein